MSNSNKKTSQNEDWQNWAAMAQKGDKRAYNQLLKSISPFIRAYIIPRLANADWADDITQEVLLSVHKSLKTYSPQRPFRPWLISIINFRRTDFLRKHYSRRDNMKTNLDVLDFEKKYVTNPEHIGEYKDIEKALNSLPERQRTLFKKIKIEGYTAKEVANEMGMSVSAVKVSAHRAMKKIRDILK